LETLTVGSQSYEVATEFNPDSGASRITYPDGSVVERDYNSIGALSQIRMDADVVDTRTYDPAGRLQQSILGNGVTTGFDYRADHLVSSIDTTNSGSPGIGVRSYNYDANRNKTVEAINGAGFVNDFGFSIPNDGLDNEDRLTSWNRADGGLDQSWNLSPVGDWNSSVENNQPTNYAHNEVHELTTAGTQSIAYDANGNPLNGSDGEVYTWDFENRLTRAGDTKFQYDALGRRVSIETSTAVSLEPVGQLSEFGAVPDSGAVASQTEVLVSHGNQLVSIHNLNGSPASPKQVFVYGSYIDEAVLMKSDPQGPGNASWYYSRNQQYSVVAVSDHKGNVAELYSYDTYGNRSIFSPSGAERSTSTMKNPFGFTGRFHHSTTGLIYFRARYYDPAIGRFIGRDPVGLSGWMSLYIALFLVDGLDPLGLEELVIILFKDGKFLTDAEIDADKGLKALTITAKKAKHDPAKHKVEQGPTGDKMFSWLPKGGRKQFFPMTIEGANTVIRLRSDEAETENLPSGFTRHPSHVLYAGVPDAGKIIGEGQLKKGVTVKFNELKTDGLKSKLQSQVKARFAKIAKAARDNGYCKVTIVGNAIYYSTDQGILKKVEPSTDRPEKPAEHEHKVEN